MGFFGFIILGLIAGAIARLLIPGKQAGGWFLTLVLGVIGAILGGWLGGAIFGVNAFTSLAAAFASATAGATIVVNAGTYAEAVTLTGAQTLQTNGAVAINALSGPAGTGVVIVVVAVAGRHSAGDAAVPRLHCGGGDRSVRPRRKDVIRLQYARSSDARSASACV